MPYDRFLIAPMNTGLQTDLKPWMIPDDAMEEMTNAYMFRGRVRKRFGTQLLGPLGQFSSRLRINLGNTDGSGNFPGMGTFNVPGIVFAVGQMVSIGTQFYTVVTLGTPGNLLRSDGVVATATYNTSNGALIINGAAANTPVYFYPATPVMGFSIYQVGPINNNPTFAWDTQFAYLRAGGAWTRAGTMVWTGTDSQFFWGQNYRAPLASNTILFVTNFNVPDKMSYWNSLTSDWVSFSPVYNLASGFEIFTCRIIISFKSRLILLNTIEKTTQAPVTGASFVNRARWSLVGDATAVNAFYDDPNLGLGGFDDAPTKEAIVTANILKDRLIVFFEQSTWEYVFTNNQAQPFRWQKINDELGAQSTFSLVPFDKVLLTIGNVGIHACNGANVERIDEKIPDAVFSIKNAQDGIKRTFGIRDFETELVYWNFPALNQSSTFPYPNRILVYNYRNGSWAFNNDSFTAFGYLQEQFSLTWERATFTWESSTETWSSGIQMQQNLAIVTGNQQGWTQLINTDIMRNSPSLYITGITINAFDVIFLQIINHNLEFTTGSATPNTYTVPGDAIIIENVIGMSNINGRIFAVIARNNANSVSLMIIDNLGVPTGTYLGGGTVARVSNIIIKSKQFNPYAKEAKNIYITKVDFNVDKTENGQITVDYFTSFNSLSTLQNADITNTLQGNGVLETSPYALYPIEQSQSQLWHPIYLQTDGETIQLLLYMTLNQIAQVAIAFSDFQLHALLLYAMPIGRLQ